MNYLDLGLSCKILRFFVNLFFMLFFFLEYMAASIKAELKRLQRCKQLQFSSTVENSDGNSSANENLDGPSKDRALFTFKQVSKPRLLIYFNHITLFPVI